MVSPSVFIQLAEETGLICDLGFWIVDRVLQDMSHLPEELGVSINVSPIQLNQKNFVESVQSLCDKWSVSPNRIMLEVTEAVLIEDDARVINAMRKLKDIGIKISMDDFGTGYSSLSYLRRFPFDNIKIDRCFVNDISTSGQSKAIVQAVLNIAKCLNMTTTAEGIETIDQYETLVALGCQQMQGYFFARPRPAHEAFDNFRSRAGNAIAA